MSRANQSTKDRICENCEHWDDEGVVTGWCSKLKVRNQALCIGGPPGKALTVPRLFYCNRFEERQQGPFFLVGGSGLASGWTGLYVRFPGQEPFRLMDLHHKKAPGVCKDLNDRWITHLGIYGSPT